MTSINNKKSFFTKGKIIFFVILIVCVIIGMIIGYVAASHHYEPIISDLTNEVVKLSNKLYHLEINANHLYLEEGMTSEDVRDIILGDKVQHPQ